MITLRDVRRRYPGGRAALDGVTLTVDAGEFVAVTGRSGSGKSTLLHVVGALDRAYEGEVSVLGKELRALADADAAALRNTSMGFVFQAFHLVASWTVRQNVALPASFAPAPITDLDARVERWLARVDLAGRGDDLPTALSGGQRQRVAIARALLLEPKLLLCDEPTGSLDDETGRSILELFQELHAEHAMTVLLVTHEPRATAIATRVLTLDAGRVVADVPNAGAAA